MPLQSSFLEAAVSSKYVFNMTYLDKRRRHAHGQEATFCPKIWCFQFFAPAQDQNTRWDSIYPVHINQCEK